jgi:hypothetical protein
MYLKQVPFHLEKTVPGTFMMQGLLGGMLGGFVAALVAVIAWHENELSEVLQLASYAMITGGIVGVVKSTLMWAVYILTKIRLTAATRVSATSIVTAVVIAVIGRYLEFDEAFLRGFLVWALSVGIPIALLVGSSVKPWELFTFGSIAAGDAFDRRTGSRSILRTLGTFPLRFLSIGTLALFLLYLATQASDVRVPREILGAFLFFVVAGAYPFFSAFVTFRSPCKTVLIACAVISNIPIALVCLFYYGLYDKASWLGEVPLVISAYCGVFLIAWMIFLVARLSLTIKPASFPEFSNNKSIADAPRLDHQCLGSRFAAWQHHEV